MHDFFRNLSKCNIIVVGDVILDAYIIGEVKRVSPEAPVPVVRIKQTTTSLGGAGNVALNLAGLGCTTILYGVRGNDQAGEQISEKLKESAISDKLNIDSHHSTTTKTRVIGQGQHLLRFDKEEVWKSQPSYYSQIITQIKDDLEHCDAVILSDYDKGFLVGNMPREIIKLCKSRQIPVLVDPKRENWERFRGATCITPNTSEVEDVVGATIGIDEKALVEHAKALKMRYDIEWFLSTRGAEGMCLIGPDALPSFIKATAREVYDVSGAGDSVIATLAAGIASGLSFPEASKLANLAGGIVVGKIGSQPISVVELKTAWKINGIGSIDKDFCKINTLDAAKLQIQVWQTLGEKVALVYGCFDLIHPGHISLLKKVKNSGSRLVVGFNTDANTKQCKGQSESVLDQKDKMTILSALNCVDLVVVAEENSHLDLIRELKPDILIREENYNLGNTDDKGIDESYERQKYRIPSIEEYSMRRPHKKESIV